MKGVKGTVNTVREVVTTIVNGIVNLMTHSKYMNVVANASHGKLDHIAMARSHRVLTPGRDKIDVCLRNHSTKQIMLPKQPAVGHITAANVILALLVAKANRG